MKLDTVSRLATGSNATSAAPSGTTASTKSASATAPPKPAPSAELIKAVTQAQNQVPTMAQAAQQAARQINEFLTSTAAGLEFKVDSRSSNVIVRVIESSTGKVIRQIPSEEAIAISQSLDHMRGLLLHQRS